MMKNPAYSIKWFNWHDKFDLMIMYLLLQPSEYGKPTLQTRMSYSAEELRDLVPALPNPRDLEIEVCTRLCVCVCNSSHHPCTITVCDASNIHRAHSAGYV